jgi:hypothetical protein
LTKIGRIAEVERGKRREGEEDELSIVSKKVLEESAV